MPSDDEPLQQYVRNQREHIARQPLEIQVHRDDRPRARQHAIVALVETPVLDNGQALLFEQEALG